MLVLSVGRWGNFIRLSALVEIMFDLKIINFGYKDGSEVFPHQFAFDFDAGVKLQYCRTERFVAVEKVKRDGVERCVEFQKAQTGFVGDGFRLMKQGSAQSEVVEQGVDVKCIELCFLAVDLEKSLYVAFVFGNPKCFVGIGNGRQVAFCV